MNIFMDVTYINIKDNTMKLTIDRKYKKENYTIGKLYINGQYFCDTCEDKDRGLTQDMDENTIFDIKVYGKTAIPTGLYTLSYTYSPKFKKYLLLVNNVPGFSGIRIHAGNTADDSLGCILVGRNTQVGKVMNSRTTLQQLNIIVTSAIHSGQKIELEIK